VADEGYVLEGDGYYSVVTWCGDENTKLFGRMYYPEDFDENQTYTTIVMNHGKDASADFWNRDYTPALAKAGYLWLYL